MQGVQARRGAKLAGNRVSHVLAINIDKHGSRQLTSKMDCNSVFGEANLSGWSSTS